MQEKALVAHIELHKEVVKNAWILSYEGRKVLVIEFQETVTEDESIAYIFALAKSLVSGKGSETLSPELMKMVKGTYVRILDEEMKRLIDNGIKMEGEKMEKTCKTCKENDCGLCDRTGRLVEDDDQCEKWVSNQTDWRTRMMQTFLAGH